MSLRKLIPLLLLAALFLAALGLAQAPADFDLSWRVVAGGGGRSASADYVVQGTVGQAAAGPPAAVGADYRVTSGFWYPAHYRVYVPIVFK